MTKTDKENTRNKRNNKGHVTYFNKCLISISVIPKSKILAPVFICLRVTVCHLVMFSAGRSSSEGIMLCLGWPMKMAESQRSHTFPGSKWSNVTCSNKTWAYCMCFILTCSCRSQMGVIKHDVGELIQPWRCLSTSLNNLSHLKL